jgi:hypothetical protein
MGLIGAVALLLTFALAFSWVSVLVGVTAKDPEHVQIFVFTALFPVTFVSNAFVETDTLPGWLQAWVKINPVTKLSDATRGLLVGGPVAEPLMASLMWALAIAGVFVPLAMWAFAVAYDFADRPMAPAVGWGPTVRASPCCTEDVSCCWVGCHSRGCGRHFGRAFDRPCPPNPAARGFARVGSGAHRTADRSPGWVGTAGQASGAAHSRGVRCTSRSLRPRRVVRSDTHGCAEAGDRLGQAASRTRRDHCRPAAAEEQLEARGEAGMARFASS